VLRGQLALIKQHESLRLQVRGGAVSDSASFGAFMGYVALGNLLLLVFGVELLGDDEFARVRRVARDFGTSPLAVMLVEGLTPRTLDVLKRALAERLALVAAAQTDVAKLAALERDANLGDLINELKVPLGEATAGLYLRGTPGPMPTSKVGLGGAGQTGNVQSRATQKQQGGGYAMVAFCAPPRLNQERPEGGPGSFVPLNHLRKLVLEGFEGLLTLAAGSAGSLHAVSMAGGPRSDPVAGGESTPPSRYAPAHFSSPHLSLRPPTLPSPGHRPLAGTASMAAQGAAAAGPGATHQEQVSAGAAILGKSQTGAHPRQARPGGALGLSRGAGPGRGRGAAALRRACCTTAFSLTRRSLSLPSRRQGERRERAAPRLNAEGERARR